MGGNSDIGESSCDEVKSKNGALHLTSGPYKCEYEGCQASFKKPSRLKQHICSHTGERPFKCDKPNCGKAYTHSCHLKRHIANSHTTQLFKITFKCSYPGCDLQMSNEYNLKRHYRRKHQKVISCNECGKRFLKNHHLRTHMSHTHGGESPYRCEDCKADFDTASNLRRHLRCHKTHTCDINGCKEIFIKWTELLKHVKTVHPLEYICDVCGLKFKVKENLRQHVHTHMKDRPTFPCPYPECSRFYSRSTYLKYHIKWKHLGLGGHKCTFDSCDRVLSTKAKLLKHLAWHERGGRKPIKEEGAKRKPRKDKGIAKRSMASLLSGLPPLPPMVEKKIMDGESLESDEDIPLVISDELEKICKEKLHEEQSHKKIPEDVDLESVTVENQNLPPNDPQLL